MTAPQISMGIGWLFLGVISIAILIQTIPADAQTPRQLINDIKDEITRAQNEADNYTREITEQNLTIKHLEGIIEQKKSELREIKKTVVGNPSFDAVTWTQAAQKAVDDAQTDYQNARDTLADFITKRSDQIKKIDQLRYELNAIPTKYVAPAGTKKVIGIVLSNSCRISDTCPTYAELAQLDTSDHAVSGILTSDGRLPSEYVKSWRWYDTDGTLRIIVDPPAGHLERIPMITIVPSLDDYKIKGNMGNGTNRVLFHERYVENCSNATISAKSWLMLVPITITDLRHGCQNSEYDEREVIPFVTSPIDITTSPNWQYQQKLNESIIKCKGLCFEY